MTDPLRDVLEQAFRDERDTSEGNRYTPVSAAYFVSQWLTARGYVLSSQGVTLTREPGLREAATRFVNHVQEVSCDHAPHRGTHTSCPEVLTLVAALASEDRT